MDTCQEKLNNLALTLKHKLKKASSKGACTFTCKSVYVIQGKNDES